jgi:hypothetical protein
MSQPTQPEDPRHNLTNCCNFCCAIIKTSIDYWQINDENRYFHPWNQTFTQMKPTTLTYQIKHCHPLNQSLSLKLTIYLVALIWIPRDLVNCSRQYKALGNFTWRGKASIFKIKAPLPSTRGAADEVWYHGYHAKWTQREGIGGRHESAHSARRPGSWQTNATSIVQC